MGPHLSATIIRVSAPVLFTKTLLLTVKKSASIAPRTRMQLCDEKAMREISKSVNFRFNKSSAVAEMGDHLATTDMG